MSSRRTPKPRPAMQAMTWYFCWSRVLRLDEPSLGLAPPLVSEALGRIQQITQESGMTVLIVEQKVREVLKIAQRVYVLRNGRVSFSGPAEALKDEAKLREVYL